MQFIFDSMKEGIDAMALAQAIKGDPAVDLKLNPLLGTDSDINKNKEDVNIGEDKDPNRNIISAKNTV